MTAEVGNDRSTELRRQLLERRLHGRASGSRGLAIPRVDRDRPLALSFGQQRLWFLDQLTPGSTEYVVPIVLRLRGPLDPTAVELALSGLVARHEVLRTRYVVVGGEPVQVIDPATEVALPTVQADEQRLHELVRAAVDRPFDLARGPVWRALLVRLGPAEHVLVLTVHHIACDGWSTDVLARELAARYDAHVAGRDVDLPALPVQYADFVAWQRDQLAGKRLQRKLDHWQATLAGLAPLELPTDRPRSAPRDPRGARVTFGLPADLGRQVAAAGREHGTTPFMILLAAFYVLLARWSGQSDLAVGTPMSGRGHSDLEDIVGFFVNTVVLRCDVGGNPTFAELLGRVRDVTLEASANQDLPFERLVQTLDPERDLSRTPVVDTLFLLENAQAAPPARMGDLSVAEMPVVSPAVKVDLTLGIRELGDGSMLAAFEYATAVWDEATIERMSRHYVELLAAAVRQPHARLRQLPAVTTAEIRQLADWNATSVPFPQQPLHELVRQQAARTPDAVAVTSAAEEVTYAELVDRAQRLTHELRARGVRRGSIVAVCLKREADLVTTLLAILMAGAGYLPVDPDHPAARIGYLLDDAGASAVISREHWLDKLAGNAATVVLLDRDRDAIAARPVVEPPVAVTPDDLAYVIYTSGSTGRPKGVMVPHRGIVNRIAWMQRRYLLTARDRVLQKTPYTFDVSVWEFFWPLVVGARIVVAPPEMHLDPMALAGFIADQRVTHLHFVPSMLDVFLDVNAGFPTCCTQVFCSGEALRGVTAQRLLERSAVRLHNLYGPTEASVDVTAHEVTGATRAGAVPIGGPIDNITTHVLDAELYPVPVGVHGEIYLGGVGLAWGYLNRPELTAERFVPDPFGEPGARLYRTGDRCRRRPDGEIEFLGRLDHQVKIRGLRIEPGEVEAALAGHPAVAGAVVAVDQPPAGDPRLVAYVVPADGRDAPSQAELRAHLAQQLPAYMIPAHFVTLDALPTTASGKANRNALPAPDAAAAAASERAMVPPRTPLEEVVAAVWAQTLGLDRVGVEDGFFDLGGDSMRAVRVVGALRDRGIEVSVADLFQQRTVAALAAVASAPSRRADDRRVEPFALVAAADRDRLPDRLADAYPLSQVQAGMVFEMLSDDGYRPYHNVTCYAIRGQDDFSAESLRAAARAVVLRHEVLRTSFDLTSYREPMQLVHRSAEPEVAVDDLRSFPVDEQRAAIEDAMTRERAELFDLGRAPLWRLRAHQVSDRDWWLSMVECHAILDGWSHNALLTELLDRYRAVRGGAEAVDASRPLPVRFADFVAVERQTLRGEADRGFWAELLATHARVTIPDSWGDPTAGDEVCTLQLPVGHLDAGLRRLASAAGVPLKSVFLAGYLTALAGVSPESRFFIGLVCNGRLETRGGDEVYGMFLNTVPVPADVYAATWQRRVADVFAAEVALWPHRRYPIAAMQREMGAGRPLIETTFNYLDFYAVDQQAVDLTRTVDDSPNEFPLVVTILPGHVQLTVRSRRLSPGNAAHLGERYVAILAAMAGDAHAALDSLPMPSVELPSAPEPTPVVEVERDVPHTAPGNPVEQAIADVWAELLGVDQVGIDDDFVQLGGHSLTAMRVSARLRTEHGIDASPRDVLRLRTVRRLAGGLPSPIPSSLVWLRRSGSRPPIVLVHPGGGGVHWYRELADALPADLPVAAIQHPAVTDPALAGIAVEELADRYLADLSAAVPGGPVRLLGWCGGAPVTWQVARRLHAAGEPTLLCLLDPALEGLAGPGNPPPQLSLLRRCEARFEELRGGVAAARADELRREIVGLLHVVVDDDRAHALISDDPDDGWHDAVRVWRRLAEARLAYRYQPYPGQMHLIVGDELVEGAHVALSNRAYEDYLARWRVIAPGGVRVHRVAGSHVGVLRPPRVTALAALLDQIAGEDPR